MSYAIDGETVTLANLSSDDVPAEVTPQYARAPGVIPLTAIQPEPAGGGRIVVRGRYHATGEDMDAAYRTLVDQLDAWRGLGHDSTEHRITLHGVSYPECQLESFQAGRKRFYRRDPSGGGGETGFRVDVQFIWRRLTTTIE